MPIRVQEVVFVDMELASHSDSTAVVTGWGRKKQSQQKRSRKTALQDPQSNR